MLTNWWVFDAVIMVCILASSACLAFDGPTLVKGSNMANNLQVRGQGEAEGESERFRDGNLGSK